MEGRICICNGKQCTKKKYFDEFVCQRPFVTSRHTSKEVIYSLTFGIWLYFSFIVVIIVGKWPQWLRPNTTVHIASRSRKEQKYLSAWWMAIVVLELCIFIQRSIRFFCLWSTKKNQTNVIINDYIDLKLNGVP